jgi:hypothetical protein
MGVSIEETRTEDSFVQKFNLFIANGNFTEAAKVAATAPQGITTSFIKFNFTIYKKFQKNT